MATEKAAKQGLGAKFMHWYGSYQGKDVVNIIYSAGASVVIIGALFKILHWPGASTVLMIGMFTEAFLFLIGTLEHPHPEFHWENVFPQLLEFGTKPELLEAKANQPRPTLLGAGMVEGAPVVKGEKAAAPSVPSLKEEDMQALKDSIADLAKTASQLSELDKVAKTGVKLGERLAAAEAATDAYSNNMATAAEAYVSKLSAAGEATQAYTGKLSAAGSATENFTQVTAGLTSTYAQVSEDMKNVATETRAYKQNVEEVGQKVASLNSLYELQLQTVNAHMEAQKSMTQSAKEAAEAQVAYTKSAQELQKQVADLNAIYGNMLNALA